MSNAISIKGTREGLTITMSTGDFGRLTEELAAHLRMQGQFFRGGRVAVRLGGRLVAREELERLGALLESHQMVLRTVITSDAQTASAAQTLGLHVIAEPGGPSATPVAASQAEDAPRSAEDAPRSAEDAPRSAETVPAAPRTAGQAPVGAVPDEPAAVRPSTAGPALGAETADAATAQGGSAPREGLFAEPAAPPASQPAATPSAPTTSPGQPAGSDGDRAFLIRRNVRSGQVVHHTGHVVVIGDVNAGAEVWATGDVIIWGRLRGTVRAGSSGNTDAVICALEMRPSQLRIGDSIARPDDSDVKARPYPEVARVRNGAVVVEPWASGRGV